MNTTQLTIVQATAVCAQINGHIYFDRYQDAMCMADICEPRLRDFWLGEARIYQECARDSYRDARELMGVSGHWLHDA